MSTEMTHTIRIDYQLDASPAQLFDAWLAPEKIAKWLVAPSRRLTGTPDEIVKLTVDARVGGKFSFLVKRGDTELDHVGEYKVLDKPKRLVFTWGVPAHSSEFSEVGLVFVPQGAGTLVTLTVSGVPAQYVDLTERGWTTILVAVAESL